ncbi:efflux RND transporter periplasmic adaptor subunit [Massilia sp. Root335]|uniref:efflux RND transporter periplasmic adaptor subunit n=1 Tax=Massilia sp. Root335 TaxID=1736517 RepID=UPI0006FC3BF8|nr:efflux RND transporter periplasmic adaptor subunit [Massilia sp. Root335]KQV45109.1 cation transporter [Massilia sp. Root335]
MKKRNLRQTFALGTVGACTLGLGGWGVLALHAKEPTPEAAPPVLRHEGEQVVIPAGSPLRQTLAVATVNEQQVGVPFVLPAAVEADPAKLVKVLPPVTGRIVSLNKQLGEAVKVGDVLFTIDSADLAQANADAAKAGAALTLARRNLERQRELDASDIASKHDVEQARNDYEQAASEAARAGARLAQLGARMNAAPSGHVLAVRAPISGRVVDLTAGVGGYWNDATAPLMVVADLSHVFVTANAQEKDLAHLYEGQSVSVRFDAYPEPREAKVGIIGWTLDSDTRTMKVRIPLDNRDGRLRAGMFAQATFVGRPHAGLLVPTTAVVQSGFATRAFVETSPWKFTPRTVKLGAQVGDQVEVVSGLAAGERVVVKNGVLLND